MKMSTNEYGNSILVEDDDDDDCDQITNHQNINHQTQSDNEIHHSYDNRGTYPNAKNIQESSTPTLDRGNETPHDLDPPTDDTPSYSALKVRVLLPVISALYISTRTLTPLILQYLLERWSTEAGHNSTVTVGNACDQNESDPAFKEANDIQSRVASVSVYFSWCSSCPALVACFVFGAMIDLVGRKPGLIISQLGSTLQMVLAILIMQFHLNPDLFYVAYAFDGIGGSFMMFLVANLSSVADVSNSKKSRITWIAMVTTLAHLFGSVTNVAAGYLIGKLGYVFAAMALLACCSLSLFLAIFVLPETLPSTQRQNISFQNLWSHNKQVVLLYVRDGSKEKRWSLFLSLMIFFINTINLVSLDNTDTLYQKHEPFCWSSVDIGYYVAFKGVCHGFCGVVYLWIFRCIGCASDEVNSMVSLLMLIGSFVLEAFVKNTWEMYMVPILAIPSANVDAITRGLMSYLAGPDKQGVLFSSIALIEVFCVLLSGTIYSNVYAITVDFMPGAVYFVMAGMALITFLMYIPFFHFYGRELKSYDELL